MLLHVFVSILQYFFLNFITFKLDHQTPQNGDIARSIIETKTKLDIDDLFLCLAKFQSNKLCDEI